LTIEGRVVRKSTSALMAEGSGSPPASTPAPTPAATSNEANTSKSNAVVTTEAADKQVAAPSNQQWNSSRTFTRTVWLPHPINVGDVKAKLEDGVLTIRAGRADLKTVNITVD
jgi:hypothetical protein